MTDTRHLAELLEQADTRYAQRTYTRLRIQRDDLTKAERDEALEANPHPGPYWDFIASHLARHLKEPSNV